MYMARQACVHRVGPSGVTYTSHMLHRIFQWVLATTGPGSRSRMICRTHVLVLVPPQHYQGTHTFTGPLTADTIPQSTPGWSPGGNMVTAMHCIAITLAVCHRNTAASQFQAFKATKLKPRRAAFMQHEHALDVQAPCTTACRFLSKQHATCWPTSNCLLALLSPAQLEISTSRG